jgi:hypothetical protein
VNSADALRSTLIWAACGIGAPELASLDEENLLLAVHRHRLESRFLHQVRTTGLTLPQRLGAELTIRHQQHREMMQHQAELYSRLRAALRSLAPDASVAPVKGFGLYALTGADKHVRYSCDLDVIGSDPAAVARAALSVTDVGYHHHGEDHPYVFAHMNEVEVHARYLVTGFPADEPSELYDVGTHPGVMQLGRPFSVSAIEYPTVAENLVDTPLGPVPAPELAALVRCAHIYVGFAMDPYPLPVATVRLDELAQVMDLVALDTFDPGRFRMLSDDLDADLVVAFARQLCHELFEADPFEAAGKASAAGPVTRSWFPQNLWWDGIGAGFPVRLDWSARDLVVRGDDRPGFVAELSPTALPIDAQDCARASFLTAGPADASRYFWHAFHDGIGPVDAEFALSEAGIRTTVILPATPDDQMSMVGVASGESRVELFFKPLGKESEFSDYSFSSLPPGSATGSGNVCGETHALTIDLPWPAFGRDRRPAAGESVTLVLRFRQQVRPWRDVTGGVVAPLIISC